MSTHVMVDIETWNLSPSKPLVLSIGAIKFDADTIIDRFHVGIDPVDSERYGLVPDAKTMLYWFKPSMDVARQELLDLPKIDLYSALDGFFAWCGQTPVDERGSLWGKGATFDNVRIKALADIVGLEYPFTYRQDECYRTMANRVPEVKYRQIGTAHNGVADAESQAVHLQLICKDVGIKL